MVAPVPWAFPLKFFSKKYKLFARIPFSETQDSIEVFHPRYLVTPKFGRSLYGFMYFLSILRFITRLIKDYDFDLLDVHWAYPDGFAGVLLGRLSNKPVIITVRGSDINHFTKFFLRRKMIAYALKKASRVIAVSKNMGDKVSQLGVEKSKIVVIPNGVAIDKFYPLEQNSAREKLGLSKGKKIILSIGRLGYPKRYDHIIEAIKILVMHKNENKLLLIIVGEGEYREQLQNHVEVLGLHEHVKFVGSKPNEELVDWYNAADVFCLASSSEGWPNVILESLACGTPVIAYAVGGVPEILRSETYGILVRKRNPMRLAEVLCNALKKTWDTEEILKYAQSNTWDSVAHHVHSTFQSVIEEVK